MTFNAKKHLIQLKGKWYLETKYRLMWMRDEHPDWRVGTEVVSLDPPLVKATVYDADGTVVATGHGGANDKGNAVWSGRAIEKAETAALGRALAHAGFGTQFLESDANHLAYSPIADNGNGKAHNVREAADKFKANSKQHGGPIGREAQAKRDWPFVFSEVRAFYTEEDDEKAKAHWWNGTVKKLMKSGDITDDMADLDVVAAIITYKKQQAADAEFAALPGAFN